MNITQERLISELLRGPAQSTLALSFLFIYLYVISLHSFIFHALTHFTHTHAQASFQEVCCGGMEIERSLTQS